MIFAAMRCINDLGCPSEKMLKRDLHWGTAVLRGRETGYATEWHDLLGPPNLGATHLMTGNNVSNFMSV